MSRDGLLLAAERALERDRRMQWRIRRFGYACLTEREYQAMIEEMQLIEARSADYREADREAAALHLERMQADLRALGRSEVQRRHEIGYYEALRQADLLRLQEKIAKGIQQVVATRMGISQGRVSQLLKAASELMQYLADQNAVRATWQRTADGLMLNAPVVPTSMYFHIKPLIKTNTRAMMKLA